jgi:hypothetical protein
MNVEGTASGKRKDAPKKKKKTSGNPKLWRGGWYKHLSRIND